MTEPGNPPKPLLEEVIARMLAELLARPEFDSETVEALRRLAAAGMLKRPPLVTRTIKVTPRGGVS